MRSFLYENINKFYTSNVCLYNYKQTKKVGTMTSVTVRHTGSDVASFPTELVQMRQQLLALLHRSHMRNFPACDARKLKIYNLLPLSYGATTNQL